MSSRTKTGQIAQTNSNNRVRSISILCLIGLQIRLTSAPVKVEFKFKFSSHSHEETFAIQVSLRDPLRHGADDNELKEIIGAAVCSFSCLGNKFAKHHFS